MSAGAGADGWRLLHCDEGRAVRVLRTPVRRSQRAQATVALPDIQQHVEGSDARPRAQHAHTETRLRAQMHSRTRTHMLARTHVGHRIWKVEKRKIEGITEKYARFAQCPTQRCVATCCPSEAAKSESEQRLRGALRRALGRADGRTVEMGCTGYTA